MRVILIVLYSLSRKMHLKGIFLLDCVNWGSKVPQLVHGLKLACWMHGWSAAMAGTCRVLGCINETQDWVPWSCNHLKQVDKMLRLSMVRTGRGYRLIGAQATSIFPTLATLYINPQDRDKYLNVGIGKRHEKQFRDVNKKDVRAWEKVEKVQAVILCDLSQFAMKFHEFFKHYQNNICQWVSAYAVIRGRKITDKILFQQIMRQFWNSSTRWV